MIPASTQSVVSNRLTALRARHAAISREIDEEHKRPAASEIDIRRMKLEKLKIKEEMEGLR